MMLMGLTLVVAAPALKVVPKIAPHTLIGQWVSESAVVAGRAVPAPVGSTTSYEADGTSTSHDPRTESDNVSTYTTDAKKSPAEIDFFLSGGGPGQKPILGIFKIEGDTLTVCFNFDGARPTKFESPAGSEVAIATLKWVEHKK